MPSVDRGVVVADGGLRHLDGLLGFHSHSAENVSEGGPEPGLRFLSDDLDVLEGAGTSAQNGDLVPQVREVVVVEPPDRRLVVRRRLLVGRALVEHDGRLLLVLELLASGDELTDGVPQHLSDRERHEVLGLEVPHERPFRDPCLLVAVLSDVAEPRRARARRVVDPQRPDLLHDLVNDLVDLPEPRRVAGARARVRGELGERLVIRGAGSDVPRMETAERPGGILNRRDRRRLPGRQDQLLAVRAGVELMVVTLALERLVDGERGRRFSGLRGGCARSCPSDGILLLRRWLGRALEAVPHRLRLALEELLAGLQLRLPECDRRPERPPVELRRAEDDGVDDPGDRLAHERDGRAHLLRQRAESGEAGEEADRERECAGERACRSSRSRRPTLPCAIARDRVEHRVDEVRDLLRALDDEHDDLVDPLAGLDEGGRRDSAARRCS